MTTTDNLVIVINQNGEPCYFTPECVDDLKAVHDIDVHTWVPTLYGTEINVEKFQSDLPEWHLKFVIGTNDSRDEPLIRYTESKVYVRPEEFEGKSDWIWTKGDTGAWDGPVNDWVTSHKHKFFEHVKNFRRVVTAGANHGLYAREYAKRFKKVWAFEPDALTYFCLRNNLQDEFFNVTYAKMALGDIEKMVGIHRQSETNTGMNQVVEGTSNDDVMCVPIDKFKWDDVDLIQLDVEGYEPQVLLGARDTIMRCKPVIILENGNSAEIQGFMEELGYHNVGQSVADTIWVAK